SNPVHTRDVFVNRETVFRTVGSTRIRLNLLRSATQNLDFVLQSGFDYYSQFNMVFSPPELQFERNSDQPGHSLDGETRNLNTNLYLNVTHLFGMENKVFFRTSAGLQFENQELNNTLAEARAVTVTQTHVDQAGAVNVFQDERKQFDRGFYVQEEVDVQGKLFLTAGVRGDASSSHGDTDKFFLYPKASASLRLSQFDFWEGMESFSNEFKIRLAYGETGNSPPPEAKYISLDPRNIDGNSGVVFNTRRGNPNIKPERTKEIETGFDATLFQGKGLFEFTYYRQNISDLILTPDLPPSSGFTEEFINGGEMKTQGVEISLGATPLNRQNLRWTTRVNFYKTSSEITQLSVDPFNIGGFATFLGTYRIQVGWSPTSIVGAERNPDGSFVKLGDETPDFELGFNNRFKVGQFDLGFHLHWKKGGEVINLGKLITDLGGTTEDYDTGAASERLGLLGTKTSPYIEDGSYIKLREAYIYYTLSKKALKGLFGDNVDYLKIGVTGRNIFMITDYTGYDPEVSQFGSVPIGRSVDTIPYPSSRSFYFNLSFGL
ncbi:MAG: TonB-dependent receptor, partial [Calditrichaeota bacterium]